MAYKKENPLWIYTLSFFSLLKNTKILPSKLDTFTLVKVFEQLNSVCYPMSYNECLLPYLVLYKQKEALIILNGEINGKGNIFSFVSMEAHSPPLNAAPICICIFEQLGIHLVSKLIHFHKSPESFESIQRIHRHIPCITYGFHLIKLMLTSHFSCYNLFKGRLFYNPTR